MRPALRNLIERDIIRTQAELLSMSMDCWFNGKT